MSDSPPRSAPTDTTCCIAGGGPAGMMLGYLLARAGVEVTVLEKHADFLRDFRGDTIHPSTLELMNELGLLDEFLARPHQELRSVGAQIGDDHVTVADFSHLPTRCKFIALMPQWDFLDFLAEHARRFPHFHLRMRTEARGLITEGDRVVGVKAQSPEGEIAIRAALVVSADGRHSTLREAAGLPVQDLGAPIDVLWMRISRRPEDPGDALGHVEPGRMLVMIDRQDYWQCALVIPKDGFAEIQAQGLDAFRANIRALSPWLDERVDEIRDWSQVKLLSVRVDRLERWSRPGFLCIGDAAHAMSPIAGVGINLAVQDAVAAANLLAEPLRRGEVSDELLRAVQRRREWPARMTQRVQIAIQDHLITPALQRRTRPHAPWVMKLFNRWPALRRWPARWVGLGFRPEHVQRATPLS